MLRYFPVVLFLLLIQVQAQELTMKSCVTKALQKHPDIQNILLGVKQTQSNVTVAKADYLPQIQLSLEYDPKKTYVLPQNGVFNTIESDGSQATATLNQKIWDFSKTTASIQAYKTDTSIAKLSLQDAKALLAYKVKLQYELIIVYKKAIEVRKKDMQNKEELYKQADALVKQGMRTKADALRFLSSLYIAQDNLASAKADFDKARVTLSSYIGEDVDKDASFKEEIAQKKLLDTNRLQKEVLTNNPALQSIVKTIEKDTLLYKATQASHYGSLDAIASYSRQNTLNLYDSTLIGIVYTLPIYSGGRTSALVQSSLLQKEKEQQTLYSKELALKEELKNLLIDIKRYDITIQAKIAQIKAAKETEILLNARYKEGLSTYIEVLDATSLLLDANLGLLQANYTQSSMLHRIEYLQGKTL